MENNTEAIRLRLYMSNTDKFRHSTLSETIIFAAKRYGLSGATTLRGSMGYGSSTVVHSSKFWEITEKMPVIVEIVDNSDKIDQFLDVILPWFQKIPTGCLITSEKVHIVLSKPGRMKKIFNL